MFGSTAAAITLYGLSLIYGATGSVSLAEIGVRLVTAENRGLVIAGIAMSMAGILFKVAVVPFHWWVPDVYRVAPAPAGALIASAFKVAGFLLLGRLAWLGFGVGSNHWVGVSGQSVLAAVAVASMVVGNLGALAQVELRRLVGFSAVGHAGYLLLGVVGGGEAGLGSVVYYAVTYGLTSLGLFGMVLWLERENGHSRIDSLRGSGRRHPWAAACMAVLVLSLASIPPLPGFFGKFYLFVAVLQGGQELGQGVGLVAVAVLMSAVSLYYYLRILKVALVEEWEGGPAGGGSGWFLGWLGAVTGLVLLAGLFPGLILSMF